MQYPYQICNRSNCYRGVKKPLNPVLGEIFTCYWEYPDKTRGYYIAEQTSHHPPKSSYFYYAPDHHIRVDGMFVGSLRIYVLTSRQAL